MPLHVVSGGVGLRSACLPLWLCHVFHINMLVWWLPAAQARQGPCPRAVHVGLIPSLTQPVLGADGRLALKQGALPPPTPVSLPLSDPEIFQISIHSLSLMDRRGSPTAGYGEVWAARARIRVFCVCSSIKDVKPRLCSLNCQLNRWTKYLISAIEASQSLWSLPHLSFALFCLKRRNKTLYIVAFCIHDGYVNQFESSHMSLTLNIILTIYIYLYTSKLVIIAFCHYFLSCNNK